MFDTIELSDRLLKLRGRLHIARLACEGLDDEDGGGTLIANMIFEVEEELKETSSKLHAACETEIGHIRRQVELGIAGLIRDRKAAEPKQVDEQEAAVKPLENGTFRENEIGGPAAARGYSSMG
jgi:hypothetical protein